MRFFDFFKNKSPTQEERVNVKLVTVNGNSQFSCFSGDVWDMDVVRACVRPFVQAVGKLDAKHLAYDTKGQLKKDGELYMRMLLEEPNALMSGQMLQEKLAWNYIINNNAYALIERNSEGFPVALYPLPAFGTQAIYDKAGRLFLRFSLQNSQTLTVPYTDVIHLRRDYSHNDLFGCEAFTILDRALDVIATTDNSIVKAVRNSGMVRWLLKYRRTLSDETIKENVKKFTETFLNSSTDGDIIGVAGVSAEADIEPVETKDYVPNQLVVDRTIGRIYNYFNTNEAIVQSKYTEDEWNSYFEAAIEPFAKQMSLEFTRKLFTRRERGFGNRIVFDASSLQYASMATKLNLLQMVDRGAMTPNEWRSILNLTPIEGGDKPIRRLDTAVVDNSTGKEGKTE